MISGTLERSWFLVAPVDPRHSLRDPRRAEPAQSQVNEVAYEARRETKPCEILMSGVSYLVLHLAGEEIDS
jgi:hypothetical protein